MNNPIVIGKATLHNCDCMELLKSTPDKFYDLAIVDPPYGIGIDGQKETSNKTQTRSKTERLMRLKIGMMQSLMLNISKS